MGLQRYDKKCIYASKASIFLTKWIDLLSFQPFHSHLPYPIEQRFANAEEAAIFYQFAAEKGRTDEFELYERIERIGPGLITAKRNTQKSVCANVDFYSGFAYSMLDLPLELYTPIFAIARIAGRSAHRMEEIINKGKIIRPAYMNICPARDYKPFEDR